MHTISGKVVRGDGYGKKLGFPTVNLEPEVKESAGEFPHEGVYAGTAFIDNKTHRAGIVIGPNNKIEAHILEYSADAYGKQVVLKLEKFLREFKKFNTEVELIIQIKKDLEQC